MPALVSSHVWSKSTINHHSHHCCKHQGQAIPSLLVTTTSLIKHK